MDLIVSFAFFSCALDIVIKCNLFGHLLIILHEGGTRLRICKTDLNLFIIVVFSKTLLDSFQS
jgi:hypothetical protein